MIKVLMIFWVMLYHQYLHSVGTKTIVINGAIFEAPASDRK